MGFSRTFVGVALLASLFGAVSFAQENEPPPIPPLSFEEPEPQVRIVPKRVDPKDTGIYTTKEPEKPLPWVKQPTAPTPTTTNNPLPSNLPFARQAPTGPVIPSAPHGTQAVPVENVDAVEVQEAAPATPIPPAADPAKEDPAEPTELTSPIFDNVKEDNAPRKILFRVLNKVTAQAALMEARPGEVVKFGKIDITAQQCRASMPNSQTDYAGLFDVREHVPDKTDTRALFHGWMYASSPSVTALEHPIYDLTMVECRIAEAPAKPAEKAEKKAKK